MNNINKQADTHLMYEYEQSIVELKYILVTYKLAAIHHFMVGSIRITKGFVNIELI